MARAARVGAAAALCVAVAAGAALAQNKEYRYETDPVRLGLKSVFEGDLVTAKAYFDEAIANSYRVEEAHRGLGEIHLLQGRYREADAELNVALAGGKEVPEAHAALGLLALREGRPADAEAAFNAALAQDKKLWRAQYGLARLALQNNDLKRAEDLLKSGSKKKGLEEGEQHYRHGMALLLLAQGKIDEAETQILLGLALAPSDPDVVATVGDVYEKKGVAELAIAAYNRTLEDPKVVANKGQLHYRLGLLYEKRQAYQDAIKSYQAAIQQDSSLADAYRRAGNLFNAAKQYEAAAFLYLKYTQLAPQDADGLRRLADACVETKRYPQAFDAAKRAVAIDSSRAENKLALARAAAAVRENDLSLETYRGLPETLYEARDYMNIGTVLLAKDERDEARTNLETAASLDSSLADAYFGIGRLDILEKDYAAAEQNLIQATMLNPSTPGWVYLNLGVAQLQLAGEEVDEKAKRSRYGQAIRSFSKSAEFDPKSAQARVYLGQTYAILDRADDAVKAYQEALSLDATNAGALKGLGFILIRNQRYAEAEQYLQKASEGNASDAGTWVLLGQARAYQAKVTLAQAAFQRALALDPANKQAKEGLAALAGATGG
jgi:tetratricopeptide (TPR) repeat protein